MKDAVCLLHHGETWSAAYQGRLSSLEAYPRLARQAWLIENFAGAPAGQIRLSGKVAHAPALIERKVRNDGLVDGESRVLIHRQRKQADGLQALYTAVPLTQWQKVCDWAAKQQDHCLILPLTALAAAGVGAGEGRVLRHGRQLMFFAETSEGYIHASVVAYGDRLDDLIIAARALGEQAHRDCGQGKQVSIGWCPFATTDLQDEAEIIQAFRAEDDCPVELCPLTPLNVEGHAAHSALPFLLSHCTPAMAANSASEKLAATAERLLPLSLTVTAVMALGLFTLAAFSHHQATAERQAIDTLQQQARQREVQIAQLAAQTPAAEYPAYRRFIADLGALDADYNPAQVLAILKQAAGNEARILRVRLEPAENNKLAGLVVDGVLRAGIDPATLTHFLVALKTAGYEVIALDPAEGVQDGSFSYRLIRKPLINPETAA